MRDKIVESFSEAKGSNTKQQRLETITQNISNKKHTNQRPDIFEQKQVEDALRESETKMRSILENIGIGVALISPKMEILELNARMREWFPAINPDQHPICYQAFNDPPHAEICDYCPTCKTLQDGLVHESTTQTPQAGGVRNYRIVSSPIINPDGDITAAIEMVEDITEHKQAEQEHLDNLHFFESMDRINRAIQGTNDLEQMMSDVLDEVLSIFDCDRAWLVYPCDPEATSWCAPMERTKPQYPGALALGLEVPIDSDVVRVFRTVLASDGPVQFHSLSEHALPSAVAKQFNEQSQIAMAIYPKGDKPYMFGLHQCSYPRTWTPQEEKLLKEIGRRLADGLTSLLMYHDLKARENKYRELADSITDVFFAMDKNLRFTYWNKASEKITGIQAEDALGKTHQEIFPDMPWAKRVEKIFSNVLKTQKPRTFINEIEHKREHLVHEIYAYPSISGISVFVKDITEQKQAEREHLDNLHFFESMDRINKAMQGTNDLEQKMSDVLDEVLSIFDCDRVFLVYPCDPSTPTFKVPAEVCNPEYPGAFSLNAEIPMTAGQIAIINSVLQNETSVAIKGDDFQNLMCENTPFFDYTGFVLPRSALLMAIRPKTGPPWMFGLHQCSCERIWTQVEKRLFKEIGRRMEDGLTSLLMYRDLKTRENKYRELADSITDVFFAMDKNLRFTYWNKASEKITGIQAEDALGKTHQEIFPDMPWAKQVEKIYRAVLKTQKPRTFINEIDHRHEHLIHEIYAYPSISGISVFIKDITEKRKAQEALETSQVQLSQALKIAKIGYWEYDFTDRMFIFNDQFYSVYHISAEKVGGYKMSLEKYAQTFLYPEDARILHENMWKLNDGIDTLENVRREHKVKFGDGKTGYVSVIFFIGKKDDKGRVTKIYGANQDITEQQQAQEELKESEIRYRELFKNMTSGVAVYEVVDGGKDFIFRDFNRAAEKYDKQSREELIGKSVFDVRPGVEEFGLIDAFRKALKSNKPVHHPIKFYKDERITGWYDNYIYPLPSGEIVTVFDDVTEKKQALEAMRKSEERLRLMTETIEDVFWMSTPGIKEMRYISSSYEKIWGRTCKSIYENPKSFLETVHPDDRNILLDTLKTYHEPGKQYSCEYRIVPSQGQIKWISERGYPVFDENGNLRYMTGVCSDITNYKLAEEALKDSKHRLKKHAFLTKTLLDGFPCTALLLRPETREIVTSNKAAVEVGAVSGKTCFETWAQRSEPCPWCLAPKVWKEGKTQHLEVEYMGIAWDAYWVPVSDDLYMHFAFDITERKQIEKRVFEYQKQLKSLASQLTLVEEKERYRIATELHDHIGQYLAVSSMKLKEIRQSIDSEETQSILESVCEWLNHVIDETRSLTFNLSSPILFELGFERAVAAWLKDEVEKKHNIETFFESDELSKLLDDNVSILLFRSVRELLFNIIKHAQAKKVHVSIGISNGDIEVQIKDDGIGFDYADVLETAGLKAKFGLFSIRERLEYFGGSMQIDSAPGKGTIIKLFAPLKRI